MSMIFSGSYECTCEMYYAQKDGKIIRLEIYNGEAKSIVQMYESNEHLVSKAIDTPQEVSSKFTELHSFKKFPLQETGFANKF